MSDQPPPPPQSRPRPSKRPPPSAESKFIGYLVLGFGILAVVAVLMIAFMGRGPDTNTPEPNPKTADGIRAQSNNLIQAPKVIPPEPEYKLPFKRQPDFDRASLNGNWQTMIGIYTAVLQMNEGVYQIILAGDDPYMPRYYSSGTYKLIEDIIIFEPQLDWPEPITKSGSGNYQTITVSPFNIMTAEQQGKLLWANIPPEEGRVRRIYEPPLFLGEDIEYVVWKRID